jgi:hypothetical protein
VRAYRRKGQAQAEKGENATPQPFYYFSFKVKDLKFFGSNFQDVVFEVRSDVFR